MRTVLRRLGVGPGWRCLEVGAGGGSLAAWLGGVVGSSGTVVATDLHVDSIEALDAANVEVRHYDVRTDDAPGTEFDLAYARLVVEYVGVQTVARIVRAVRPGGVVLLADYDWASFAASPAAPATERLMSLVHELMTRFGLDPWFGRRLPEELRRAGIQDVQTTGHVVAIEGASFESGLLRRVVEAPAGSLIAAGAIEPSDVATALAELADPRRSFTSPTLVAAWGAKA